VPAAATSWPRDEVAPPPPWANGSWRPTNTPILDRFRPIRTAAPKPLLLVLIVNAVTFLELRLYLPQAGPAGLLLGLYASVVWALPVGITSLAACGALLAARDMRAFAQLSPPRPVSGLVIVQIPTIGRHDVIPALSRVVESFETYMPRSFTRWRVDVVAEESCEASAELERLASPNVRILYVPARYRTAHGAQRKARANQWVNELRQRVGEARSDVWVLHMDDDTGIGPDTPPAVARVINENPVHRPQRADLAQGVLTYPRAFARRPWPWLADAIRPGSDVSLFRASTGGGRPFIGVHGELLLVRASTEAAIGWDFGRHLSITEDANFALLYASTRRVSRSTWFPARCYGSSPETMRDLVAQRCRWSRGLLHVVFNRSIPLRSRALLGYALTAWLLGPFQHFALLLAVGALIGHANTSPLLPALTIVWAWNMGVVVWIYAEGLRCNARASGHRHVPLRYWLALLAIPAFTLVEGWAGFRGLIHFVRDRRGRGDAELFHVIPKTHNGAAIAS
jgi:beta-1,4-mannosyltransferase